MPSIKFDAIIETAKVVSGFKDIQNAVSQTAQKVETEGKTIDDVISNIQSKFNVAIGGWSAGKFVNQMMQVRGQFQQTEMAFKTMLQSEEKAKDLMKEMIHTAAITPFGVEDVTNGAKQLLAYNIAAEDVNDTLIRLGDVAAGMGINLSDMVMLYGTTIAKGKMDTRDLYQFLNRGIPIADELAKVMGLDVSNAIKEVQKQITAGKVTSDIFIQAMQSMTAEGSKFGGLMEEQSKTITGQISNIEDGIEQMFNELGRSQEGVINSGLDIVSKLVDNWEKVGKVLLTVVAAYGAYKAAVIAMVAISKAQIALKTATAFLSLAKYITSAKDAMLLFNMATKANPLGLLLGVLAAAATYFGVFGDSAKDAGDRTSEFVESANKASNKVETLIAILKTAKAGSKVYKDTIKELASIYSDYGITIDKIKDDESNLVDVKQQEIEKSQELIEQIKLEATERNRANAISNANEKYNKTVEDAQDALDDKLKSYGTSAAGIKLGIENLVSDDVVKQYETLSKKMEGLNVQSKEYQDLLKQYNSLDSTLINKVQELAQSFGFTGSKTNDAKKALVGYLGELRVARKVHTEETDAANKAADATENFGSGAISAADRVKALQKQLQGAGDDVHTLYSNVKKFMGEYSNNDVYFHVNFDAEIPAWMKKMDIPELGRMGKYFSALAKDMANNGKTVALVNGKRMTRDEVAQRGWDYTNAANTKQTEADEEKKRNQRKKEEDEANAKKNASKIKKEAEDRRKAQEELNKSLEELQQKNIDSTISLMREGTEKKIAEIKNDYKKQLAEIDKQEAEFKKKNKEAGKGNNLTDEQSDALNNARELAEKDYNKKIADTQKEEFTAQAEAMRDYLKNYGTYQQQKLAIAEEYAQKIKEVNESADNEATKQWKIKSLEAERDSAVQQKEVEAIKQRVDWGSVFGEFGAMFKDQLQPTIDQLKAIASSKEFKSSSLEEQKTLYELINKLEQSSTVWDGDIFKKVSDDIMAYQSAMNNYITAQERERKATEALAAAKEKLKKAEAKGTTDNVEYDIAKTEVARAEANLAQCSDQVKLFGAQVEQTSSDLQSSSQQAVNQFQQLESGLSGLTSGSLKGLGDALLSLDKLFGGDLEKNLANTLTKGFQSLLGKDSDAAKALTSALGNSGMAGSIISAILGILDLIAQNGISGIITSLQDTIFGAVEAILDDVLSGDIITKTFENSLSHIGKIGDTLTFGALSSWFGGNEKETEAQRQALIDEAEKLTVSIDGLKEELKKQSGIKAIETAQELYKLQQEKIENARNQLKNENDYTSAHHSNKHYWNNNAFVEYDGGNWESVTKTLKEYKKKNPNAKTTTDSASSYDDLLKLTPEQLDYIRTHNPSQWQSIKDVGKYDTSDEKWEALADLAGTLDETLNDLNESLTQVSFDSLKDEFISSLMDMDASAEDFSDKFSEYLMNAILNAQISNLMEDEMSAFYKEWAKRAEANGGNLTEEDIAYLKEQWDGLVDKGLAIRDQVSSITGYTGESTSSSGQDSTTISSSGLTEDTGKAIEGRFTAMQIATEGISNSVIQSVQLLNSIAVNGAASNSHLADMKNMMALANSHLEDMVKYARLTYNDFGEKMDNMYAKLKEL